MKANSKSLLKKTVTFLVVFMLVLGSLGLGNVLAAGTYNPDQGGLVLDTEMKGVSTNSHTRPYFMWVQDGQIHVAVRSTHELQQMTLAGSTAVPSIVHGPMETISIGDRTNLDPANVNGEQLTGNIADAHWTIFKFPIETVAAMDDTSNIPFYVDGIGNGHDVGGFFAVVLPKTNVTVNKEWKDGPKKPITVTLEAYAGGMLIYTYNQELKEDYASHTFADLPMYDPVGRPIEYRVKELDPGVGYTASYDVIKNEDGTITVNVVNTYNSPKTSVTAEKKWVGGPLEGTEVELQLYANGEKYGEPQKTEGGSYTWTDLDETDKDGNPITYTVKEVGEYENYESTVDGYVVTNKYLGAPKIEIEKSTKEENFEKAGDVITYVFKITNTGDVDLKDVKLVDEKLGLDEVVAEKLATGESITIEKTYTVTDSDVEAGKIYNIALSSAVTDNDKPVKDDDENTIEIKPQPEPEEPKPEEPKPEEPTPSPCTDIEFIKTWKNVPEGKTPVITIDVVDQFGKVHDTVELTYPETNYTWNELPQYNDEGEKLNYTVVERKSDDFVQSEAIVTPGAMEIYTVAPNKDLKHKLDNTNFLIFRQTTNGPLIIWTLEEVENKAAFVEQILANAPDKQPIKELAKTNIEDIEWYYGSDLVIEGVKGSMTVLANEDGSVNLEFSHKNVWTHFAYGGCTPTTVEITNTYKDKTPECPECPDDKPECPECPECPEDKPEKPECPECPKCPEEKPEQKPEDKPEQKPEQKPGDKPEQETVVETVSETKAPKTGDSGVAYIALTAIAAAGAYVGMEIKKRKENK